MKKLFLFSVAVTLLSSLSFATIRRVGYPGTPLANVDYADLQAANDAASNNDTIQIYGSVTGGTISKPLVILGFGYNFDANTGLQAIGTDAPSYLNTITMGAGSNGSIISGVASGGFYIGDVSGSHTPVSNITFQRCNGSFIFYNHESYGPANDIKIISSVITGGGMQWNGVADYPVTNLQVYNCIIYNFTLYKANSTATFVNCAGSPLSYVTSYLTLNDAGCLVKNCILAYAQVPINVNTIYENNFFGEALPAVPVPGSNNRWGQDWTVIFNRLGINSDEPSYSGSTLFDEDYYILKTGSPAINGGFNIANQPTNCGIFGGELAYVYKVSGVPAIPAIYQLTAPNLNASSNPYNVTISVRSNN